VSDFIALLLPMLIAGRKAMDVCASSQWVPKQDFGAVHAYLNALDTKNKAPAAALESADESANSTAAGK
jgi:hypothetical protein